MNNTAVRTFSGVLFVGIMLAGFLVHPYLFAALHIFIIICMMHEFYDMSIGKKRFVTPRILGIAMALCEFISAFFIFGYQHAPRLLVLTVIPVLVALMISILYVKDKSGFRDMAFIFFGVFYIGPPVAAANALVFGPSGEFSGFVLLGFFLIIWASDVGAYIFGHWLGEHGKKLFPSVSPKKSWAGFWGGLLLAVVAGVIIYFTGWFKLNLVYCIIISVVMDVAGVYGDLFESQWKRTFGYKDSGSIIPGHGGMLDRFDSALFAIPAGLGCLLLMRML